MIIVVVSPLGPPRVRLQMMSNELKVAISDSIDIVTPVADRVFFIGIEGGFSFAGVGGFTIRFAVSELGPLSVLINAQVPGGILLEPLSRRLGKAEIAALADRLWGASGKRPEAL